MTSEPPLLLETMRLIDGQIPQLDDHQKRLDASRAVYYGKVPAIALAREIHIPDKYQRGLYKLRVIYGESIQQLDIHPYTIRPVNSLQLVPIGALDYAHKYADRRALQSLFAQRSSCDDVLLIRDGLLTDTSYANVALYDGDKWYTPARPLLGGTARARYLEQGIIQEADIRVRELRHFQTVKLINAMMNWEEGPVVEIGNVIGER